MTTKITLLLCTFMVTPVCAMQKPEIEFKASHATTQIQIKSMKKMSFPLDIQDTATVLDVKNQLKQAEGIPVDCQRLLALKTVRGWFYNTEKIVPTILEDATLIKTVMDEHKTSLFQLFLVLPKQSQVNTVQQKP